MTLLLLLIVPVVIGLIGFLKSGGEVNVKEFLVLEASVVLVIGIGFAIGSWSRTTDVEIWSGVIATKEKHRTGCCHSYPCNCHEVCSGSGENRSCSTHCDTCYQHSHDESYEATTSNGESAFSDTCNSPGSPEPPRWSQIVIGEPTAIEHRYANYVKASKDTLFKRDGALDKFAGQIPAYPRVYDWYRADRFIWSGKFNGDLHIQHLREQLAIANGKIGAAKQVDMIVIVTDSPDPAYLEALRQAWIGAKKNDFVVVVGEPEYPKVAWSGVLSWSKSEEAKIAVRDRILALPEFDGDAIIKITTDEVEAKYVRREMKDFEYLRSSVEPSNAVQIVLFILGTALSIGLTVWFWREDPLENL